MIISHKNRFVFNKPMKTGGSSLELCLYPYLGDEDVIGNNGKENLAVLRDLGCKARIDKRSHEPMEALVRAYDWKCVEYTHFTVVRNPWDRAVSLFYWRNEEMRGAPHVEARDEFRKWVRFGLRELTNGTCDWAGYPIADVVVKYEDLRTGMMELSRMLGIEPLIDTDAHRDKSGLRPDYSRAFMDLYDDETWALVGLVQSFERTLFDYSYERPQGSLNSLATFRDNAFRRRRQLKIEHDKAKNPEKEA